MAKLAIIRIRTSIDQTNQVKETLRRLNVAEKYHCSIAEDTPSLRGMLHKVSHMVTWGEINDTTLKQLHDKKGKDSKYYRMHPPRKGIGKRGIKLPFSQRGAYGNRGEKINDLVARML